MIPTDWTGNDTWVPMATVHFAAMTAALLAGWMVTGELHLLYVAAAETGLLARWRPIFFAPASPEIGGSGSMATRLLIKSVKYWAASILAVVWLAALGATGVQA